jgi:hypothetical protein
MAGHARLALLHYATVISKLHDRITPLAWRFAPAALIRRLLPPEERAWERGPSRLDWGYRRQHFDGRIKGTVPHDFWFADGPCADPLVLFQHIRKTAGTAIRTLLHVNYGDVAGDAVPTPRHASHEWFAELKASLGDRFGSLRAVAGHSANYLLPLLDGRPVVAFTVVREPVDRVISRYYFMVPVPDWTLADLYGGRPSKRIPGFFNGQARSLLEPFGGTAGMPLTADEPHADEWRARLAEALDAYAVVGTQDRLPETVEALAALTGLDCRTIFRVRINRGRPTRSSLDAETAELVRRHNWLDEELYRLANERLDTSRGRRD